MDEAASSFVVKEVLIVYVDVDLEVDVKSRIIRVVNIRM